MLWDDPHPSYVSSNPKVSMKGNKRLIIVIKLGTHELGNHRDRQLIVWNST